MKTFGEHLRHARKVRKKTIKDLSEETKIKKIFLSAIENQRWTELPDYSSVQGFVKSISNTLDLNTKNVIALLKRDYPPKLLKTNPKKQEIKKEFRFGPRLAFLTGVILIIIFILSYLGFQYFQFIAPPKLEVIRPTSGEIITKDILEVSGKTEPSISITVNDQPAFVDDEGNFYTELEVSPSLKKIEVTAKSRSGQETKQFVTVKIPEE